MYISGLALKYSEKPVDLVELNKNLIENSFLFDYLSIQLTNDKNQNNVNNLNINYLKCFEIVYKDYVSKKQIDKVDKIRNLAILIAENSGNNELINKVK